MKDMFINGEPVFVLCVNKNKVRKALENIKDASFNSDTERIRLKALLVAEKVYVPESSLPLYLQFIQED